MTRYEYGGDEFIFVEMSEAMDMETNFKAIAITQKLREAQVEGVLDICPSNASYMVRFNPDQLKHEALIERLKDYEANVNLDELEVSSRMVDVPVLFDDPWTHETLMRFRERHQDPNATDLEYGARINGYDSKEDFIKAMTDAPYLVTMIGFVPGLPWCFQLVPQEKQIEVPKYVRPRTFTPERAFGFGGAFSVIYPVQGAGGYQLFGTAAAPIFEKEQRNYDFKDAITFPRQGDLFRYRAIDMDEFKSIRQEVEAGTFRYKLKETTFRPKEVLEDPKKFADDVLRRLYA